ncbi:hypothetical protein NC651_018735 [Populus alba x Populus x berolinensis]|nr:hypothetical protein NC651_018735 [Populus alba x Populus x berolinensis]
MVGNVVFGSSGKWGRGGNSGNLGTSSFGSSGNSGFGRTGSSGFGNVGSSTLGNGGSSGNSGLGSSGTSGNVVSKILRASVLLVLSTIDKVISKSGERNVKKRREAMILEMEIRRSSKMWDVEKRAVSREMINLVGKLESSW